MFTGIIQGLAEIISLEHKNGHLRYTLCLPPSLRQGIKIGASIAIDGVCQTVVHYEEGLVSFEAIPETLSKTTLGRYVLGQWVNVERALKVGEELGGHQVSGHVFGVVEILSIEAIANSRCLSLALPRAWEAYLIPKGFIALDGASLTVGEVDLGSFKVYLIPHTWEQTVFQYKKLGDFVNIEFDYQTQLIVATIERLLPSYIQQVLKS